MSTDAIYARVSTERQADDGLGLDVQLERMQATAPGARVFTEAASGTAGLDQRAVLAELDEAIAAGEITAVWVHRLDRLARKVWIQEWLIDRWRRRGCVVRVIEGPSAEHDDDDPSRKLLRVMMGAVAEYERDLMIARTRAGRRLKASRGGYVGGDAPYGFRVLDDELVPIEQEQAAIRRARALRDQGGTLRSIADSLTAEGWVPRGARWHPQTVSSLLQGAFALTS